jgi:uncharacterized protein involved in exopolysaccharide biosynthesis
VEGNQTVTDSERRATSVPGWVIFTVTAVTVLLAVGGWALSRPALYTSNAVVAVTPKASKPVSAGVVLLAAPRYVAYGTSPYVLRTIGEAAGIPAADLQKGTIVTMAAATTNISIAVTLDDPDRAAKVADLIASEIVERTSADAILDAQVLSTATVSSSPAGPHPLVLVGAGGAAALLAGAGAWATSERYRRRRASIVRGVAAVSGLDASRIPIEGPTIDIRSLGAGADIDRTREIPPFRDQIRIDS